MPQIEREDIEGWARGSQSSLIMPQVVRRLLWATVPGLRLESRAVGEWGDAVVDASEDSSYCPKGRSIWVFDARSSRPPGDDEPVVEGTSFVIVAPSRSGDLRVPGTNTRVLGADELARWFTRCPAVAAWFWVRCLERPAGDLVDVESYLDRWSRRTRPRLPTDLVLEGRDSQVVELSQWLRPGTQRWSTSMTAYAATAEEARVFVASVLDGLAAPEREHALARAVVVRSIEAWHRVVARQPRSILIPDFDGFSLELAGRDELVLWPRTLAERSRKSRILEARIELTDPLPWRAVAERLQVLGLTQQRATTLAEESRGYLGPLQRLLGAADSPPWADAGDHRELAIMLLLGAWEPAREADRKAVAALGGDAQRLEEVCKRSSMLPDAPLELRERAWHWRAPADAWVGLAHLLYDSLVESFVGLAIEVLGEDDPGLELPLEQRWMAVAYDKVPLRSKALREGIAESLARLVKAGEDERLDGVRAAGVGRRVLDAILGESWQRWASLGELLPVLAEVEPVVFLDMAEASLRVEGGLVALLEQEARPPQWAPHLEVLRALEVLAWDPKTMARTVDVLVTLAGKDPARRGAAGRWGNRPQESLEGILHFFAPQTAASEDARYEALARVVRQRNPDVGWSLLLALLRQLDGGIVPQHSRPRFRGEAPANPESIPQRLVDARIRRLEALVFDAASMDSGHWADLFAQKVVRWFDEEELDKQIDALVEARPRDDEDRLWSVIRDELHDYYFFESEDSKHHTRLKRIYDAFEPEDLVRKHMWLLASGVRLPESMPDDFAEQSELIQRRRDEALGEVLTRPDALDLLARIVVRLSGELYVLGYTLAPTSLGRALEDRLLVNSEPGPLGSLAPYLALGLYYRQRNQDVEWLRVLLQRWQAEGRTNDALAVLLELSPEPKIWDVVDHLGEPIRHGYWSQCSRVGQHDGGQWQRAVHNLLGVGNLSAALETASSALRHEDLATESLFALLEAVRRGPELLRTDEGLPGYHIEQVFLALDRHLERQPDDDLQERLASLEMFFIPVLAHSRSRPVRYLPKALERSPVDFATVVGCLYLARSHDPRAEAGAESPTAIAADDGAWERRVIEELAKIAHDVDTATLIATNAGFPRTMIPAFTKPISFWSKIAEEARNGVLADGLEPIRAEAAKQYPHNSVFTARKAPAGDPLARKQLERPDEAAEQRVRVAYQILTAWKSYPGHEQADIQDAEKVLRVWSRAALQALAEHGVGDRGQEEVARVLVRPRKAEDGHWPCLAARELLESGEYHNLAKGLFMAKRYPRGVGMVPSPSGSDQREKAKSFERSATALRAQWPRTAELLDKLARSYQADAERRDERDREERIEDGVAMQFSNRSATRAADSPTLAALHRLELHAVGPASELELELGPRINLIVGDNGLGKTFLLDVAWWVLTGSWGPARKPWPSEDQRPQRPSIRVVDETGTGATSELDLGRETWPRGPAWPRPSVPMVYVRIDGGISVWDPLRNDLYGLEDRRSIPAYDLDAQALERGLRNPSRGEASLCNGLIEDWEHWRHNEPELFHYLFEVVKLLFADEPKPGPAVQLWKEDETPVPTLELPHGRVPIVHLSAGMKRILGLAYALIWAWNGHRRAARAEVREPATHMIVLFDEVECHLHPQWQRRLLPALLRAIQSLSDRILVQVVATTHSPLVMASLEALFSDRTDRLFHLDLVDGRRVEVHPLPWANHGEVGNWLVSPVFELAQPVSLEAERAIEAARQFIRTNTTADLELNTKESIEAALAKYVPETHEIQRRWRRIHGEAAQ